MHEDPRACHVQRQQHADHPHAEAEDQRDATDQLAEQVRRTGDHGQRDAGLVEHGDHAGHAAAEVVLDLGVPHHQHPEAHPRHEEDSVARCPSQVLAAGTARGGPLGHHFVACHLRSPWVRCHAASEDETGRRPRTHRRRHGFNPEPKKLAELADRYGP